MPQKGADMLRILQFLKLAHSEQTLMPQVAKPHPKYLRSSCCSHL